MTKLDKNTVIIKKYGQNCFTEFYQIIYYDFVRHEFVIHISRGIRAVFLFLDFSNLTNRFKYMVIR